MRREVTPGDPSDTLKTLGGGHYFWMIIISAAILLGSYMTFKRWYHALTEKPPEQRMTYEQTEQILQATRDKKENGR